MSAEAEEARRRVTVEKFPAGSSAELRFRAELAASGRVSALKPGSALCAAAPESEFAALPEAFSARAPESLELRPGAPDAVECASE